MKQSGSHKDPTIEGINNTLAYNPETGDVTWKLTLGPNAIAGQKAGYLGRNGYWAVGLSGRVHYHHRIAWLLMTGDWPFIKIDHINGDTEDNRWLNLRQVDHTQNQINQKRRSDNPSGHKNVGWCSQKKKWRVRVKAYGRETHGGFFDDLEEAAKKATELRTKIHGEFANHG